MDWLFRLRQTGLTLWQRVGMWPPAAYLLRLQARTGSHRLPEQAAVISFWGLFSLFPLLLFVFSVLGLVVSREQLEAEVLAYVNQFLPQQMGLVRGFIANIPGSGVGVGAGTLGLLWGGSRLFSAVVSGLDRAYDAAEHGFLKRRAVSLLMAVGATLLIGSTFVVSSIAPLLTRLPADMLLGFQPAMLAGGSNNLWVFGAVFSALFLTYWLVPNRRLSWKDVWPGTLVATALLVLFRFGFGLYVSTQDFSVYGSLGAVIILLTFGYFGAQIFLLGAEINGDRVAARNVRPPSYERPLVVASKSGR
ncbi:MAG: YihY/virulence factor BrkB family protein [Chloroflexi bacterium]|nr:YihY/virulence factor BrkB family protein [Chloroflexota bacterium]